MSPIDSNIPAVPTVPLTPGNQTSEYQVNKSAAIMNYVGMVLAAILSLGPGLIGGASPNSKYAIIGGAIIGLATVLNKTLLALNYGKGRTDLKVEQIRAQVAAGAQVFPPLPPLS